jgi:hypothetical protein
LHATVSEFQARPLPVVKFSYPQFFPHLSHLFDFGQNGGIPTKRTAWIYQYQAAGIEVTETEAQCGHNNLPWRWASMIVCASGKSSFLTSKSRTSSPAVPSFRASFMPSFITAMMFAVRSGWLITCHSWTARHLATAIHSTGLWITGRKYSKGSTGRGSGYGIGWKLDIPGASGWRCGSGGGSMNPHSLLLSPFPPLDLLGGTKGPGGRESLRLFGPIFGGVSIGVACGGGGVMILLDERVPCPLAEHLVDHQIADRRSHRRLYRGDHRLHGMILSIGVHPCSIRIAIETQPCNPWIVQHCTINNLMSHNGLRRNVSQSLFEPAKSFIFRFGRFSENLDPGRA